MHAYFTEGADVGDQTVLAGLAAAVGLDEVAAKQALADGSHEADVRTDIATARAYGINGVPFFVFNQRVGVSGAQPVEVFEQALRQSSLTILGSPSGSSSDDGLRRRLLRDLGARALAGADGRAIAATVKWQFAGARAPRT